MVVEVDLIDPFTLPIRHSGRAGDIAAAKHEKALKGLRLTALEYLFKAGHRGMAGHEFVRKLPGRAESSARARFTDLVELGYAKKTDLLRRNGRSNMEAVYRITKEGVDYYMVYIDPFVLLR